MEQARLVLLQNQQFYAHLLYQIQVSWSDKVPTAGIKYQHGLKMLINKNFWESCSLNMQVGILQHELDHVIFGHLTSACKATMPNPQKANIAMDVAINQHNKYLVDEGKDCGALFPETFNFPEGRTSTEYYGMLPDSPENQPLDSHEWGENDGEMQEVIDAAVRGALEKAAGQTSGTVPGAALETIKALTKPQIQWRSILNMFVAKNANVDTKITRSRMNRRFGIVYPGKRTEQKLNLVVCQDTSGSVGQKEFEQFAAEIKRINQDGIKITVIDADYDVQRVYDLAPGKTIESVKGRGGTSYVAALEKAQELQPDGVIYFGDGDRAEHPETFDLPLLWVTTSEKAPTPYGKHARLQV